jgi:aerobic carbon-monoxide dehydrogenase medium subunit
VWLDRLEEVNGSGHLRIGALVRNRALERSELVASRYPTVAAAAPLISDPIVRNRGTLVGSLCHADPQGDFGSVMLALEGELVAKSTSGERRIPVTELFDGPFTTVLRPDELAVEAVCPIRETASLVPI